MTKYSRPHWSYSSVNQYLRCPLQFYFERILKLPRTSVGSGLVLGSAVHGALAVYHTGLMHGEVIATDEIHKAFLEGWESRERNETIEFKSKETKENVIAQGISLLDIYLQQPPPENIVSVEQRTIAPLRNSEGEYLETPLVAVADLITRDEETFRIHEFKTSGRAYGEFEIESSLQATCYVNATWELYGEWSTVEFAVLVKTKTPKLQRLKTSRTDDDLGRLGDVVENVERAVNAGIFYPVETPLNCSTCPYREPCREWKPQETRRDDVNAVHEVNAAHELNGAGAC